MRQRTWLYYTIAFVGLLGLWQAVAVQVRLPVLPPPVLVLKNLSDIFVSSIAIHGFYSLWRIVAGMALAIFVGVPVGIFMGYFSFCDRLLAPVVYLTYPIPKIALLPILMLLCGLGEWSKILMIFLIVVFQVMIAVRDGIRSIPKETYFPLYSLGAGFFDILREILLYAFLPNFLTAVRVAMATSISVLFFTETFGTQYGMGYFIMDAWLRVNYLEMYSGIIVLSIIGLGLFAVIDFMERKLCHWK